ncbi:MAG TPA: BrnT family toxin [Candidatus Binatia bacterium]|nr:BrnT family toxin [Candidatus Binatia bacterium]
MEFEWDPKKAAKNLRKHKVSFNEAATVFGDSLSATVPDPDHSLAEDRYITVGMSSRGRLVMVAHTEHGERIRINSARGLTRAERKAYEEETKK